MILVLDNLANTHVNLAELIGPWSSTRIAGVAPRRSATSSISEVYQNLATILCRQDGGRTPLVTDGVRATQQLPFTANRASSPGHTCAIRRHQPHAAIRRPSRSCTRTASQILGFYRRLASGTEQPYADNGPRN